MRRAYFNTSFIEVILDVLVHLGIDCQHLRGSVGVRVHFVADIEIIQFVLLDERLRVLQHIPSCESRLDQKLMDGSPRRVISDGYSSMKDHP